MKNSFSAGDASTRREQKRASLRHAVLHRVKKKLLYLALCDPDLEVTGATVRMAAFVKYLARYYDVMLVNMEGAGYRVDPKIAARYRDHDNKLGVAGRVRVEFSRPGYFLFSPAMYRAADRLLKTGGVDYLLADCGLAALYGSWFARRYGIPLIYSSHNVAYRMYLDLSKHDFRRAVLAPYIFCVERTACRTAVLVVAISANDGREYAKWIGTEKLKVIPQGFDPESCHPFYPPPPSAPAVVLCCGNFRLEADRWAARQMVREIAPAVLRARPDTIFQLIGADPPTDLTGPNIECLGFVDDLAPYLRRANLVIAPLPYAHSVATHAIQAMAFGKTVVSTPEGASAIPWENRQLVVAPLEAFASTIVEVLAGYVPMDPCEFDDLCRHYSWPALMAELYHSIEQCCGAWERD